ncbi:MAG: FHA domain-containing protein [Acidobacteria bacterium]|nr:FHA domain-containing protein [Acidobacteriota bacterium]
MPAIDRIKSDLRSRIWESFRRHGLSFPFPTRTLEFAPRRREAKESSRGKTGVVFVAEGASAGSSVRLSDRPLSIGRGANNDLVVPDAQASKEHARIECTADGFVLVDLQSSGGTYVNGAAIERHQLKPFDRVKVGSTILCIEYDGD